MLADDIMRAESKGRYTPEQTPPATKGAVELAEQRAEAVAIRAIGGREVADVEERLRDVVEEEAIAVGRAFVGPGRRTVLISISNGIEA